MNWLLRFPSSVSCSALSAEVCMACRMSTQQFPPLPGCCVQCARHQYLGPKVVELLQCGLPAVDAFKVGRPWG